MAVKQWKSMVLSMLLTMLCAGDALAIPRAFSDLPFSKAQAKAVENRKFFLVDFSAKWCAPCHEMDRSTWADPAVEKWIEDNAIVIQTDIDDDRPIARSFRIESVPTIVAFRPSEQSKEYDRSLGYKTPEQLMAWLSGIKQGKRMLDALKAKYSEVKGKGGTDELATRYLLARALFNDGDDSGAAEQFAWLWTHFPKDDSRASALRMSFISSSMKRLAGRSTAARDTFRKLRDGSKQTDINNWIVLNDIVQDEDKTLAWFDQVKNTSNPEVELSKVETGSLRNILLEKHRWADAALLYDDPIAELQQTYSRYEKLKKLWKGHSLFPHFAADMYVSFLAAGKDAQASQIAEEAIKLENTDEMRRELVSSAQQAGQSRPAQLIWILQYEHEKLFPWFLAAVVLVALIALFVFRKINRK